MGLHDPEAGGMPPMAQTATNFPRFEKPKRKRGSLPPSHKEKGLSASFPRL